MQETGYTGDEKAETPEKVTQGLTIAGSHCYLQAGVQTGETNKRRQCFCSWDWGQVMKTVTTGELVQLKVLYPLWRKAVNNEPGRNIHRMLPL